MHDVTMKPLVAGAVVLALTCAPALAQQTVPGVFALAGATGTVTGQMVVTETAPLTAALSITFADAATGGQIQNFTEELTQELHVLAIDSSLTRLVHEHIKTATPEGVFTTQMTFPVPGTYHIYADAVPEGRGQQVLRFDVAIDGESMDDSAPELQRFGVNDEIAVMSGDYEVRLDASELAANHETMLHVAVLKDGEPAADLHPYLGVAAHAVLVKADDLSYVHAHPMEDGHPMEHDDHSAHAADAIEHDGHADHVMAPAEDTQPHAHGHVDMATTVSPTMTLHLTPPGPGDYTLFLEFIGDEQVHAIVVPLALPAS
jgi:hypothetical protein